MKQHQGFAWIHRKLLDNPISEKPNYLSVWIYLLLKANFKDKYIIWNNEKTLIKRGSFIGSISKIAQHFNLSTGTVSNILNYLISEKMIEKSSTHRFTLFTILNYDNYQADIEKKTENKLKTNRKQIETTNTDNTVENDNKDIKSSSSKDTKMQREAQILLSGYNKYFNKKFKNIQVWYKNYIYWRKTYSFEEIQDAILNAKNDNWWRDKLTLEKLFRTRNKNGECDYIGELLNK